ncbi:hypothetical protein [Geobacillus sp. YF-1]|uniref:hypothetical protein n=1 Tax=Geobacillus sp. YF-1 TaxID=3457480 RepID=UPI004045A01D
MKNQEKELAVKQKAFAIAKNLLNVLTIHEVTKRTGLTAAEVADISRRPVM